MITEHSRIPVDEDKIQAFCKKWKVQEISLFGSVLWDDFCPDSDVDVLITFAPDAHWSLFDIVDIEGDLKAIVGRDVDILTKSSVEGMRNYLRRKEILSTARPFYAAR